MKGIQDYWNIPDGVVYLFYVLAALAVAVFFLGFYNKATIWASGKDTDDRLRGVGAVGLLFFSIRSFFSSDCLVAKRVFRWSTLRGLLLLGIIWGFLLLFLGTVGRSINAYIIEFLIGDIWRFFSLVLDLAGLALLIGVIYGLLRRYVWKPERMAASISDGFFLVILLLVILTGFFVEGGRLAVLSPPAADWSPVGYFFGILASGIVGGGEGAMRVFHLTLWVIHVILSLSVLAYIPFSKGFHMFASQITTNMAKAR